MPRKMIRQERMHNSIWDTYRSIGAVLVEALDPKHWRTWPLDPKNPSKGTLSAQKASAQEKPKARGGYWSSEQQRDFAPTSRVRVTTPADDLGIKGTQTHHTTSKGRVGHKPQLVKKRTSVKGKTKEGKQIKVSDFPTSHSAKKNESILNTYRLFGYVLAEARRTKSTPPDPKHWRTWDFDPKNPSKGTLSAQKAGSQEVEGGNTIMPVKKRRTRVTKPADDLGIKGTQTHHTTTSNTVTTTNPKTGAWHTSVRSMTGKPLKTKKRTSVKGSSDGKQIKVPSFPTSHSAKKNESILNTYRSIGAVLAEARRGAPDEDSDKAAKASGKKATKRRVGKVKTLTDFERENLKSMGGEALRKKTLKNLEDTMEDET